MFVFVFEVVWLCLDYQHFLAEIRACQHSDCEIRDGDVTGVKRAFDFKIEGAFKQVEHGFDIRVTARRGIKLEHLKLRLGLRYK